MKNQSRFLKQIRIQVTENKTFKDVLICDMPGATSKEDCSYFEDGPGEDCKNLQLIGDTPVEEVYRCNSAEACANCVKGDNRG